MAYCPDHKDLPITGTVSEIQQPHTLHMSCHEGAPEGGNHCPLMSVMD